MNLAVLRDQVKLQAWQETDHGPNSNIPMPDPGLMSRSRVENIINVDVVVSASNSGLVPIQCLRVASQVTP
jgi:hypothetical protein